MLPPLPILDDCLFIDNSGWMESLSLCKRLTQYRTLNQRISAFEKVALNFGSACHLALEYRYKTYRTAEVDKEYYNYIGNTLTEFFDEHPTPIDDWRGLNWAMDLIKRYNRRYPTESFSLLIDDKNEVLCELSFAIELFRYSFPKWFIAQHPQIPAILRIIYTGRIDLPFHEDGIWVMDHKSTKSFGKSFFDRMRMSAQQKGYCWVFEQLTGQEVTGYVVNGLRTEQPPLYVLKGVPYRGKPKSIDEWWEESLQRERFILKSGDLEEWKENAIVMLEEFFWNYMRGVMPMETANACTAWGRCQYFDVCTMAKADRMLMLNSGQFTNNTWSPLKQPTQSKQ